MEGPGLVSISPQRRFLKRKYSVYVTKDKIKKISGLYLVKTMEALLPIYLNGTTIAPTTKNVTQLLNSERNRNICMHIMKLTPIETVPES